MGLHARDSVLEAVNAKGREATVQDLVAKYGPGYSAYHAVKVGSVIDMLADLICVAGSIARPEISQVVRDLVREWVRQTYATPEAETELLLDADIDYRLRKLSFLIRKAAPPASKAVNDARAKLKKIYDDLYLTRGRLRDELQTWMAGMITPKAEKALADVAVLKKKQRDAAVKEMVGTLPEKGGQLREILSKKTRPELVDSAHAVSAALAGNEPDVTKLRHYCQRFENYDMVIFPMSQNGGIDEGVEVDIVRVSPRDMRRPHTLQGSKLGHFGGFLEDDWRRNDILWGRLDAAESLICRMIPDDTPERQTIIDDAHRAIVAEQLGTDLQKRLTEAAAPKPGGAMLQSAQARQQQLAIEAAAKGCIGNDQLLHDLFVGGGGYDQNMNRDRQLVTAGRAGVIVEKILHGTAVKAKFPWPAFPKMFASAFAMLAQVAVPRSFARVVGAYWGRLLALLFIALAVIGYIVPGQKTTMFIGLRGLAVVIAATFATYLLDRWVHGRLVRAIAGFALTLGAVALGLWYLHARGVITIPVTIVNLTRAAVIPTPVEYFLLGFALGAFLFDFLIQGSLSLFAAWQRRRTASRPKVVTPAITPSTP